MCLGINPNLQAHAFFVNSSCTNAIVNYPFIDPATGIERPVPYTYGYIQLDGADNIFSHIINEADESKIKVGMRVRAVFKAVGEMDGNIQDIRYFEIEKDTDERG